MRVDVTTAEVDRPVGRAAVLGSPVKHSLSPVLHGTAYRALGLPGWQYDMIECDEPGLPPLIDGMGPEWAGLSLTMPLKRVALAVADEVSPLAQAVGAANTLVFPPGGPAKGRRAENTDVAGLVAALREAGLAQANQAVILGAGGTAQSALAAVRELGHQSPVVLVRNLARTGELRETAERLGMRPSDFRAPLRTAVARRRPGHLHAARRGRRSAELDPLEPGHDGPGRGVRAVADPVRRIGPGRRLPGRQRPDRAAAPGGGPGRADDRSSGSGGGHADRPGRRGGGPAGLNRSRPESGRLLPGTGLTLVTGSAPHSVLVTIVVIFVVAALPGQASGLSHRRHPECVHGGQARPRRDRCPARSTRLQGRVGERVSLRQETQRRRSRLLFLHGFRNWRQPPGRVVWPTSIRYPSGSRM